MNGDYKTILDYINENFIDSRNYTVSINNMTKLITFLTNKKYDIKLDVIVNLLNDSTIFADAIKVIFEFNKQKILSGQIDILFEDDFFSNTLYAYCMINNIKIKDYEEDDGIINKKLNSIVYAYLNDIKDLNPLPHEEIIILAKKAKLGDKESKNKIVEHNLKLVVKIASNFLGRGIKFEDLIGLGNIGLLMGVERFDPNKNYRFSTYATWWIKQAIYSAIYNTTDEIRIPSNLKEDINKCFEAENKLTKILERTPTDEELAKELNVSVKRVESIKQAIRMKPFSLNTFIDHDSDDEIVNLLSDDNVNVEKSIEENNKKEELYNLINNTDLTRREIIILYYRFGFHDEICKTQEEVGKILKISKMEVSRLERKALDKLASSSDIERLAPFMNNPEKTIEELRKKKSRLIVKYGWSVDDSLKKLQIHDNNTSGKKNILSRNERTFIKKLGKKMDQKEFDALIELFILVKQKSIFKNIKIQELCILLLSFGLVNGRCYANNEIADLLSMNYDGVIAISRKLLYDYRNYIDELREKAGKNLTLTIRP